MKRLTAALLTCLMLVGLLPTTAMAAQVTDEQIIDAIVAYLYDKEGHHGDINKNDNGALSVGKIQWHGRNARDLLRKIESRNPQQAQEILGEELYIELMDPATTWDNRIVNQEEANRLSALLTTKDGIEVQDAEAEAFMASYIKSARNQGFTDPTIIVYYCDMYNQSPRMTIRTAKAAIAAAGSADAVTLELLYQTALEDETAGKYPTRRKDTYDYCKSLGWEVNTGKPPVSSTPGKVKFPKVNSYRQGQFWDVAANAWYTKNVASAVEFGLMNGLETGAFNPNGNVTVAQAVTLAARIHSIYTKGSANFKQTPGTQWYTVYYDYCYQNGILTASYHRDIANWTITRAQFAEIFAKALPAEALSAKNTVNRIPDVPSSEPYAKAVFTLYRAGILTGNENNQFQPTKAITRAQVAAIASRMADSDLRMSVTLK